MLYNATCRTRLRLFERKTMPAVPDIYLNNVRLSFGRFRLSALFVARLSGVQVAVSNPDHSFPFLNKEAAVRVLLVEDNATIGNAVQDHLFAEGFVVDWSMDLGSAKTAVARGRYDVVLLDLRLPDGSGLDLLKSMGTRVGTTPVIILSAYDQISDQMTGLSIGAVDYLVKPFGLAELTARIRKAVTAAGAGKSRDDRSRLLPKAG
ncbi:response regulator [Rhizobium rhizogenes]|uniref:response regulator n=1 Tax=Rhizobium rhizogenes TaxID=359 RepID=UPI003F4FF11E